MNFRYLYISLVISFSYMLFLFLGHESERINGLVESAYIEHIVIEDRNPP